MNKTKRALITGIAGMDGTNLTKLLLKKGNYEIYGILRRHSKSETQDARLTEFIENFDDKVMTYYGDLTDQGSLYSIIEDVYPDEIYNLAAQSHVGISFTIPNYTTAVNTLGFLNLLEIVRNVVPDCRVYQACSSEQFGNEVDEDGYQRMTTTMKPVSPYGNSKLASYNLTRIYRNSYGLYISNGVLFNHSSKMRGANFVEAKIVKTAVEIKHGLKDKLELGNMDVRRDWGASEDYVRAMHLILQQDKPNDYMIATGENHSVREICDVVFSKLGMNYKDYVESNPKFMRPNELMELKGDSKKYREMLNWEPEYSFEQIFEEMIEYYDEKIHNAIYNRIVNLDKIIGIEEEDK